jgi:peptidoglycan/LPS O-acetylase OafA/YrhL
MLYRYGPAILMILVVGAILLRVLLVLDGADAHDLSYWTIFGRIDQFLIGMAAALAYRVWYDKPLGFLCPLMACVMLALLFIYNQAGGLPNSHPWKIIWPSVEALGWAGFIIGYLKLAPRLPRPVSKALASIGEISFSMYLLHVCVIAAVLQLGPLTFGLGPVGASLMNGLCLVLPGTIAVSWMTFRLIERPFLRMRVRYLNDSKIMAAGALKPALPAE